MPAIITDQYRILNAETFVDSFVGIGTSGNNNYYTFLGHPNPQNINIKNYGAPDWPSTPPAPLDSFSQESFYYDSMLFLKKITSNDVRRVIPRINWETGTIYEMYRNNYSSDNAYTDENKTPNSESTSLYGSKYYVVTSEFKVYLCINNGTKLDNVKGTPSTVEPQHTNTTPQPTSDGYIWKYLYSITPSDIVKFSTTKFIPLPQVWGDASNSSIKDAAVDGKIETVILKSSGSSNTFPAGIDTTEAQFRIVGDGDGGSVKVTITSGEIVSVDSVIGGSGYTYATVLVDSHFDSNLTIGVAPTFEVIIPPKGGHGADIFRELGAFRVMVYSRFDNNIDDSPDYVTGNNFSRIGVIKNPLQFSGTDLLNNTTATNLSALKLKPADGSSVSLSEISYSNNSLITQTVGVGSTAVGYVASWEPDTGVLKYYQPVGFSTLSQYSYKKLDFTNQNIVITGGSPENATIDTTFNGDSVDVGGANRSLGQTFVEGKASPDVKKYSGDIIYVDNRAPITRTSSQKEEVKIVIEF